MGFLEPSFTEEFYPATDDETLLVDLWAYLAARQANLPWDARGDWLWLHLEEILSEIKPAFVGDERRPYEASLEHLAQTWRSSNGAREVDDLRRELGTMLQDALESHRRLAAASSDRNGHYRSTEGEM